MAAARQQFEAGAHLGLVLGLGQNATSGHHQRVGGENEGRRAGPFLPCGACFFGRQPQGMDTRRLALADRLINGGGKNMIGNDAHLRQQRGAAWTFAGKDQQRLSGSDR